MTSETQSENLKLAGLLVAGALLEALYLRMHSLYYLKNHAIAFMVLALGAGIVYLIALYGFDQTQASRASFILLIFGALVFRATLWPMEPTLSDDLQRYRWDAKVQANGWNPYAVAPNDPRLAHLRDHYYEIMPGRETPTIYPPVTEADLSRHLEGVSQSDGVQSAVCSRRCAGAAASCVDVPGRKGSCIPGRRVRVESSRDCGICRSGHNDALRCWAFSVAWRF